MSDSAPAPPARRGGSRRRFFGKVGAVGLVASAAVFARSDPAAAANYQCCTLVYVPPNISYTTCRSGSNYTWGCTTSGGFLHCLCCERKNSSGSITGSAAKCQYG